VGGKGEEKVNGNADNFYVEKKNGVFTFARNEAYVTFAFLRKLGCWPNLHSSLCSHPLYVTPTQYSCLWPASNFPIALSLPLAHAHAS